MKIDITGSTVAAIEFSLLYTTGNYRRSGTLFIAKYNSQNITSASVKFVIDERTDMPIVYKDGSVYIPCQGWSTIGIVVSAYTGNFPSISKEAIPTTGTSNVTILT